MRTFTIIVILMLLIGLSARAQTPSDTQSKLKALEDAYKAGILSKEEYASKKAELEKQSQVLDESKQQKLKALEAAYQAGILSEEEYARKKAELLGAPAAVSPEPGTVTKYRDPQGRFEFQYPGDWNVQPLPQGQGITLIRGKAALSVVVLPEGVSSAQQVLDASMSQISAQWQNYQELRRGNQSIGGVVSPLVEFTGINPQGMPAHAQTAVFVSGAKGYMFMLTAPEDDPSINFATVQPLWQALISTFTLGGEKGKAYRHSTGFSFLYPEDWSLTEQEGFLQLTPPNPSSADGAPTEMYFVLIEDASQGGIQNPEDPAVLEYLDSQIQSLSPALKRTGAPLPISIKAGKGAVVNWGATGTGGEVLARAFVGVVNNYGLVLIGMGLKQQIEARDPILRQMFSSFGFGEPQQTPAVSTIPGQAATGASAASPAISGDEIGDPNWGFKFRPPQGWKFQKADTHVILGHDTIAGMIIVIPHVLTSFQELQSEMQSGLSDEGVQMYPAGSLQSLGNNVVAGEYTGVFGGEQAKARGIGTFSPHGGGAYIVAVTTPDKYGAQLSGAADAIARAMQYFKVEVSELISHFAGTWAHTTGSTLTNITFGADGSYEDTYEAGYYGDFTNDVGDKTGFWDATGQEKGKGRWIVRGNKEQGVIIIYHANGNEETLQYKVFVEKGQTYWREYLFNGKHYSKIRD